MHIQNQYQKCTENKNQSSSNHIQIINLPRKYYGLNENDGQILKTTAGRN